MRVLGLNAYTHDAGIALVENGRPVFVLEEERLDRVRKTRAFPALAIRTLRERFGFSLDDIDAVVFPWRGGRFLWTVAKLVARRLPGALNLLRSGASPNMNFPTALRFRQAPSELAKCFESVRTLPVEYISHHDAHASTAFFLSPYERAAVLVMDGFGDECSTSIYHGIGGSVRRVGSNRFFDSVGILYSMITKYLGFRTILDEGKVMALAAYGSDDLCAEFRDLARLHSDGRYEINERFFGYHRYGELQPVSQTFIRRFGPPRREDEPITQRHMDIARALQTTLEETVLHVARHVRAALGEPALCFAGGTALNCLTNQRIVEETGFEEVYVPPNPNDSGVALGAALAIAHRGHERREVVGPVSPFLGPSYDEQEIGRALVGAGLDVREEAEVIQLTARSLADGRLVAWFQGAAEMGPRALGNRSILGDPRDPFVPDALNRRVKHREYFRPYAPAVLAERVGELFEGTVVPSPYMSFAPRVRASKRGTVPAIVARNGTARIQTVAREDNPLLYGVLMAFATLTGVPAILNTSFNGEEPTVCTPTDAIRTFSDSGLDMLVMGRHVVRKRREVGGGAGAYRSTARPAKALS